MNDPIFIVGFPRSFSTLFCCLAQQNPSVYASSTSPFLMVSKGASDGLYSCESSFTSYKGFWEKASYEFVKGGMSAFWASITNKPFILDKNRNAIFFYDFIMNVYPNAKFIFLVRDLTKIFESYDNKIKENSFIKFQIGQQWEDIDISVDRFLSGPEIKDILSFLDKNNNFLNKKNVLTLDSLSLMRDIQGKLYEFESFCGIEHHKYDLQKIDQIYENDAVYKNLIADHCVSGVFEKKNELVSNKLIKEAIKKKTNFYKIFNFFNDT
jgi:hypothetical protein